MIIGHRGSGLPLLGTHAGRRPALIGNTRHAIANAVESGADWIEIDIRKSADPGGDLVVFHDETLAAKTDGIGRVEERRMEYLKSRQIRVEWFQSQPEHILSLDEVFTEFHADKRRWILDVKVTGIRDELIATLEQHHIDKDRVILFGQEHILREFRTDDYRLGCTTLFRNHADMMVSPTDTLRRCRDSSIDLLVVPVVFVTPTLASVAERFDVEVWSYDTNDTRDLDYCVGCGVRGLIVDNPQRVKTHFRMSGR